MVECISAQEAWSKLEADSRTVLIDVRTAEEWRLVGLPDLSSLDREPVTLTWNPHDMQSFADLLRDKVPDPETPVLFLCRSGMRSQQTAELAAHLGYQTSINIVEGFEGPPDGTGQRGRVCGWLREGLPIMHLG